MMTIDEIKKVYEELLTKEEEAKRLGSEIQKLKAAIIEYHNGEPTMIVEDYQSKLTNCTRMTLLEKLVQERYNIQFTDDDYKVTPYVRLSVSRVKA